MAIVSDPVFVMQRYELKYIITREQEAYLRAALEGHMQVDRFGLTTIASLYYDTPDRRLVRASIERPQFKEKMRLRSYGLATDDSPVFLELKRKCNGIVYKRRAQTTVPLAEWFLHGGKDICDGQICHEMTAFRDRYGNLEPACLILYDRTAFFEPGGDLRLTIDNDPRYRVEGLDLRLSTEGISLLPPGSSVLEIKVQGALPLWLCRILDGGRIYKSSFSKYGEAYKREMLNAIQGGIA